MWCVEAPRLLDPAVASRPPEAATGAIFTQIWLGRVKRRLKDIDAVHERADNGPMAPIETTDRIENCSEHADVST
jgi:hypothetical protein